MSQYIDKNGYTKLSATSQPRQWGLGSKKRNPSAIKSVAYPIKRFKPKLRANFDPRPQGYSYIPDMNSFVINLQNADDNSMFQSIFKLKYEDFKYSDDELQIIERNTEQFIRNLASLLKRQSQHKNIFEVSGTCPQGSEAWLKWRSYFITSSNSKIVSTQLRSESAKKNFMLKNLWRVTKPITTVAMAYGKLNEDRARKTYAQEFLEKNQQMNETGLMVNLKFPYLATSPDGVVMENNVIDHIIEIKCPKLLEKCKSIHEFDKHLTKSQLSNFFLEKRNHVIGIKSNHPYLYQMIMSLIIFEVEMCMLIVWCPANMVAIPIYLEDYPKIENEIKCHIKFFYENVYIPEIFCMRSVRDLPPIELKND